MHPLPFRLLLLAILFTFAHPTIAATAPRPNIIFILADDLGFETLGCYGGVNYQGLGPVKTKNLDALAQSGMRFKYCFSTPVCSPARSEFLTGKYNFRTGFIDIAGRKGAVEVLDTKAHPTVAMALKTTGYVTAVTGKWHVGPPVSMEEIPKTDADTTYAHPTECGFDRQYILGGAHLELYGKPTDADYTPARIQRWALNFLESRQGKTEPFFLYYPSPIPHDPLFPTPLNPGGKTSNAGKNKKGATRGDQSNFPSLIEYLDQQVGEIVAKLQFLGLRDNTLILFSGDNGTRLVATQMRDGRIVKGGKGTMKDTGSWVPLLASWPGTIKPASVYDGLIDFTDFLPTFTELAGAKSFTDLNGISFAPQLRGQPGTPREWIHSHYVDKYFVRGPKWKLSESGELFDITGSPYEEKLIAPAQDTPETKAARAKLQAVLDQLHSK